MVVTVVAIQVGLLLWIGHAIGATTSMLAFGDLSPDCNTCGTSIGLLFSISYVRGLVLLGLTSVSGPIGAQNGLFLGSFLLPSMGIVILGRALTKSRLHVGLAALAFGSLANPVIYDVMIGGGDEYNFWLFFTFVSFALILWARRETDPGRRIAFLLCAGIAYSLSVSASGLFPFGFVMSFPLLLGFLLYLVEPARKGAIGRSVRSLPAFVGTAAAVALPLVYYDLAVKGFALAASSTADYTQFLRGNIAFDSQAFGPFPSLTSAAWSGSAGYVGAPFWAFLVVFALTGGLAVLLTRSGPNRSITCAALGAYLIAAAVMVGFYFGDLTDFILQTKVLDQLTGSGFYLWMQELSLPILFLASLEYLERIGRLATVRVPLLPGLPRSIQAWRSRRLRSTTASALRASIPAVAVCLILLTASTTLPSTTATFQRDQPAAAVPSYYGKIGSWFNSGPTLEQGLVLVLPNTYQSLDWAESALPPERVWNLPIGVPLPYNVSIPESVLDELAAGDSALAASDLAIAGVQFVLVGDTPTVTLVPTQWPYALPSQVTISEPALSGELQPPFFSLSTTGSNFSIFKDLLYDHLRSLTQVSNGFENQSARSSGASVLRQTAPYSTVTTNPSSTGSFATYDVQGATPTGYVAGCLYNLSYSLFSAFTIQQGVELQIYEFGYNYQPTSSELFEYNQSILVATENQSGSVHATLPVPSSSQFLIVFYYAYSVEDQALSATISSTQVNVSGTYPPTPSAACQSLLISQPLINPAFPDGGLLVEPYQPKNIGSAEGLNQMFVAPLEQIDPGFNQSFVQSVRDLIPSATLEGQMATFAIIGNLGSAGNVSLTLTGDGTLIQTSSSCGPCVVPLGLSIPNASPSASLWINISSPSSQLGVTMFLASPGPGTPVTIEIPLANGTVSATITPGMVVLSYKYDLSEAGYPLVPLLTLTLLAYASPLVGFWLTRRFRRRAS